LQPIDFIKHLTERFTGLGDLDSDTRKNFATDIDALNNEIACSAK
jgi:hypothetical protein